MRTLLSLAVIATALPVLDVAAAENSAKPAGIGVTVSSIYESRSTTSASDCRLVLNLTGDAVADAHSVREVRVTKARDELDRDLTRPSSGPVQFAGVAAPPSNEDERRRLEAVAAEVARRRAAREAAGEAMSSSMAAGALLPPAAGGSLASRAVLTLRSPSRQSQVLTIVEGEIDLFTPTKDNGGIVEVSFSALRGQVGDPLPTGAAELGVDVVYMTQRVFAAKADLFGPGAKATFASAFKIHGPDAVLVALRDPKQRVVDFELQDGNGKRLVANPFRGGSDEWSRSLFVKTDPPAETRLVLRIATPAAVKSYPFKLEKVPLP